jgi:glycosyltransferase involved in cell wall biosynthesis
MNNLSIIVPVYNKGKYLEICIRSILSQTVKDFELILVNDGSADNSAEICDAFQKADARVTVIHQQNQGVSAARNVGLNRATGKYIGFVDADDFLDADMYETLLKNAIEHSADISICGVRRVFPDKVEVYGGAGCVKTYTSREGISAFFKGEILMSNYDKIYKRDIVQDLRFVPALFEDTYYNFEAIRNAKVIVFDDAIKYNYMIRDNSHSMAAFNQKYMNTLIVSKKMVNICARESQVHFMEAKAFDFTTNMIMLNMILIESKGAHKKDLKIIMDNLSLYDTSFMAMEGVRSKYKIGYQLLLWSQTIYQQVLRLYSLYTKSEHLSRKQKSIA